MKLGGTALRNGLFSYPGGLGPSDGDLNGTGLSSRSAGRQRGQFRGHGGRPLGRGKGGLFGDPNTNSGLNLNPTYKKGRNGGGENGNGAGLKPFRTGGRRGVRCVPLFRIKRIFDHSCHSQEFGRFPYIPGSGGGGADGNNNAGDGGDPSRTWTSFRHDLA